MATQKSRQPPQTTSIHQTISTSQLTNPNLSKPQANHTLTPISPFPIFHNFPIFCLPVLRMLLIPSLHGTAVGSVRHSATASGLCFQLIEVLQDQLPTTLPWCSATRDLQQNMGWRWWRWQSLLSLWLLLLLLVLMAVAGWWSLWSSTRWQENRLRWDREMRFMGWDTVFSPKNWQDSADFRCDAPSALALYTLTRLGEKEIWAEWQLSWLQSEC